MFASQLTREDLTDEMVWKMLYEGLDYKGENADVIVCLGSLKAPIYRVPVAVELYRKKKADSLLFCGGKKRIFPDGSETTECEKMRAKALELGVPEESIFLEDKSENTVENFIFSKEIISKNFPDCKKVIVVTTAYHQRRAVKIAEKILGMKIYSCPAKFGSARADNWYKTEKGRKTALDECLKFGYYIENGFIDDFEIGKV